LVAALLVGGSAPGVCADNGRRQILDGVNVGELVAIEGAIFLSNRLVPQQSACDPAESVQMPHTDV
jgi:hypothetical protein